MPRNFSQLVFATFSGIEGIDARSASKGIRAWTLACAAGFNSIVFMPVAALADPHVDFDIVRAVECRDITPPQRLQLYPNRRLIEVALPVSVRFHDVASDDVDEIDIEVSGASSGMRVHDFAPSTQMTSDITREIETTTTSKKNRSLDGTLGGSLPIPGADAAARVTPSITAALSGCETATEKINRLPAKHAIVVSGTSFEGRGVFFKLKRNSQTSLEGVHELAVTFVAPRSWPAIALQLACTARGQKKMLWMKQSAILGHAESYVQLMPAAPGPVSQTVLKPTSASETTTENATVADGTAASPPKWRPSRTKPVAPKLVTVAVELKPKTATPANPSVDPSTDEIVPDGVSIAVPSAAKE